MATGVACPAPILQFFNNAGEPNIGGTILTQVGGVNTATYQDVGLTTPLPNPIPLNSRGEVSNASGLSCQLFLTPNVVYIFTMFDAAGNQMNQAAYVDGVQLVLTQATIGAAFYPQTAAELAAGVTPVQLFYAPGIVDRYQTNTTPGTTDMHAGVVAALASNYTVIFPYGPYLIGSTIVIAGNKTITGLQGGDMGAQAAQIVHLTSSTGPLFQATGTEFGSLYIGHFSISGGNGSYCLVSTRPQATYEYLNGEIYNGGGIQLQSATQGSWEVTLRNNKFVAPNTAGVPTANAYRAYSVSVNGGNTVLDHCLGTYQSVGVDIIQGQGLTLSHCDFNTCGVNASDSASAGQCGIRMAGTAYKQSISIRECWIEGCVTSIWLETCNNVDISDCFIDDLGNTNTPAIYLASAAAQNVKIDTNWVQVRNSAGTVACVSNAGQGTLMLNNTWNANNVTTTQHTIINSAACTLLNNVNASTNNGTVSDPSHLINDITPVNSSFTATLVGCTTSPTGTVLYAVNGRQVTLNFPTIAATSNSTGCSITGLPAAIQPATGTYVMSCTGQDAGAFTALTASITTGSGTITLAKAGNASGFTNTATTKGISASTITYLLT